MTASRETDILAEPWTAPGFCFRHPGGAGMAQTMVGDLPPDENEIEYAA